LISFFPRFPTDESDNQYHLQALRHCYALAVKRRDLVAIDVDTREELYLPIQVSHILSFEYVFCIIKAISLLSYFLHTFSDATK
jgi:hypothetical protein